MTESISAKQMILLSTYFPKHMMTSVVKSQYSYVISAWEAKTLKSRCGYLLTKSILILENINIYYRGSNYSVQYTILPQPPNSHCEKNAHMEIGRKHVSSEGSYSLHICPALSQRNTWKETLFYILYSGISLDGLVCFKCNICLIRLVKMSQMFSSSSIFCIPVLHVVPKTHTQFSKLNKSYYYW